MANEFKVKKGLIVDGSNTVVDVQGTQGQLFSVTDSLTGDLFSVSDVSGVPIFNVNSSGRSTFDGITSITSGGSASPSGEEGLHLMYDTNHAYIKAENNGVTNRPLTFTSSAYTFSAGNATFNGDVDFDGHITLTGSTKNIVLNNSNELRAKDSGGTERTITRVTSGNLLQYGWSGAGDIEFKGGGSYTTRMVIDGATGRIGIGEAVNAPSSVLHVLQNQGANNDAVLRLRGSNTTNRITRLQLEDYKGTLADGLIQFRIPTADTASSAVLEIGVNSAGLIFDHSNNATFTDNVISKNTFYLENASGKRWQQLFDGSNSQFRYYNGSSWSTPTLKLYATGGIDVPYNGSVFGNQSTTSGTTVLTLSSYEPFLVFKKGRDASSGYDYFKIKCENDAMAVDFTTAYNGGSDGRTARITSNGRWVIGGYEEVNGSQLSVQGTFGTTGNASFGGNIALGGGALQTYHSNVTSVLAMDDQTSLFTRADQLFLANNCYYNASDVGKAIETGKTSLVQLDRDKIRFYFTASASAGGDVSFQEKFRVNDSGELSGISAITSTLTNSILIDYAGSDGNNNDAGLKIMNDGSDWGAYIRKDNNTDYGLRIDSGGANAFNIYSTTGGSTKTFGVNGQSGETTIAGRIISTRSPGSNNTDPTIALGDGNTGFYERSDNDLRVTVGGVNYWEFSSNCMGNVNEGKAHLNSETATSTNPSVIPWRNDSDTGIGRASANNLSLIAGGAETLRLGINLATFNVAGGGVANSGATVFDVQGASGQLFSVTESLTGDLFSVSDISGVPILNVNSSGQVDIDGNLETGGIVDPTIKIKSLAGGSPSLIFDAQAVNRTASIKFHDNGSIVGGFIDYIHNGDKMNFGAGSATGVTMTVGDGMVSMGIDAYATATNAKLQLPSYALAIKNNVSGSNNNWSYIRNTATGSSANVEITTGLGIAATFNHDKTTTFQGNIHTDAVNNKANSHNMIYRSGTNTLVGGGGLANKVYIDDTGHLTVGAKSDGTASAYGGTGVKSLNIQAPDYPVFAFYAGSTTPTLRTQIISYSTSTYFGHASTSAKWTFNNGADKAEISSAGTITAAGDVIAYGSPSDISLKENIKPIESALDKVNKLKGVTFTWKDSGDILNIKEDIGFIAQDVQEVLPELVRENDNGKLSLRDKGIVPVLVEAIKELKVEIEELKKQIK